MINITKVDHIGIRVRESERAINFYKLLGFEFIAGGAFEQGHPIIMEHPSGVVINLLGPAGTQDGPNVLMDIEPKPAGYTHMALRVISLDDAKAFFAKHGVELSGQFAYKNLRAVFIRDPDNNVIEFDEYPGEEPETREHSDSKGYADHP